MDIQEAFNGLIQTVINALPRSPFAGLIEQFSNLPGLGWLNWFIPVRAILTVMAGWLVAIAAFYLYSIIARWVKVIGD